MSNEGVYVPSSANDASARVTPGSEWEVNGGLTRNKYVLAEDLALAANDVVEWSDTSGYEVTKDRAGGSSLGRAVAGVALGTVTDAYYGVIQVAGVATMKVAANTAIAAGSYIIPHPTTDGAVTDAVTTSTERQIFAVALAASTDTTSAAGTVTARILRV